MLDKKKINFLLTGIINTLFGYALYSLLIYIEINYKLALLFSYFFGITFNFISYKIFVFKKNYSNSRLVKYFLSYLITYYINIFLLPKINLIINNFYFSQILLLPFIIIITWILLNRWVFK